MSQNAIPVEEYEAVHRLDIALEQVYASLLLYFGSDDEPLARLAASARRRGLVSQAAYQLMADAAQGTFEGDAVAAAAVLSSLSRRIFEQVPIGSMPDLPVPTVLDTWASLSQARRELELNSGFATVRDDDGYCVLFSLGDIAAWLIDTPTLATDPDMIFISSMVGRDSDNWASVDSQVPVGTVETMLSDMTQRVAAVLVFSNEDYSGEPVGLVTARTFAEWRRGAERRRRRAKGLLDAQTGITFMDLAPRSAVRGAGEGPADRLVSQAAMAKGGFALDAAIVSAIAAAPRGLTVQEVVDVVTGLRTNGAVQRRHAEASAFGSISDAAPLQVSERVAHLRTHGVLRRSQVTMSLLLTPAAIEALQADDPAAALEALAGQAATGEEVHDGR